MEKWTEPSYRDEDAPLRSDSIFKIGRLRWRTDREQIGSGDILSYGQIGHDEKYSLGTVASSAS